MHILRERRPRRPHSPTSTNSSPPASPQLVTPIRLATATTSRHIPRAPPSVSSTTSSIPSYLPSRAAPPYFPPSSTSGRRKNHPGPLPFPPFPVFSPSHYSTYPPSPSHPRTPPTSHPPPTLRRETARRVHFAEDSARERRGVRAKVSVTETVGYITPTMQGEAVESVYYLGRGGERPFFMRKEGSRYRRRRGEAEEDRRRVRSREREEEEFGRRLPEGRKLKRVKGFFWG